MVNATDRVFSRIPGTDHPSMDGKRYLTDPFDVIRMGLAASNWTEVTANDVPAMKNRTYAHPPHMFSGGERGGPMATYLVSAMGRSNFHLWINTSVERINRVGGHAVSLDLVATSDGGRQGTVSLTPTTGRVVLSAGAFGTPKLLFRSGIGPTDQLQTVQQSVDGAKMTAKENWVIHPTVGYNLNDHLNTDTVISHPNVSYYDWPAAWLTPNATDQSNYLTKRIGPLAQAAPNIGPIFWEEIMGPDGILRHMQWQGRAEGSNGIPNGQSMTLSLYLGRGQVSRGRATIQKGLNMIVDTIPYGDPNDMAVVATAIDNMVKALKVVPNLTWNLPPLNQTGAEYLKTVPLTYANVGARRANHWMGTAKIGSDSALKNGTAVVDINCLVSFPERFDDIADDRRCTELTTSLSWTLLSSQDRPLPIPALSLSQHLSMLLRGFWHCQFQIRRKPNRMRAGVMDASKELNLNSHLSCVSSILECNLSNETFRAIRA